MASDAGIGAAYALVAGISPADLPGLSFLIDGQGWLRGIVASADAEALTDAIASVAAHPLDAAGPHAMRM